MKLTSLLKKFRSDESGAVTVDWVVLTAAIVGLGVLVVSTIGDSIRDVATNIATEVGETHIGQPIGGTTAP